MRSLLERQSYLTEIIYGTPDECIDLDKFREIERVRHKGKRIIDCFLEIVGKEWDYSQPWLENIKPADSPDILVQWTTHYHDKREIDWSMLRGYDIGFVGQEKHHKLFQDKYQLEIPYCKIESALEFAELIKGSKLFIGNQSIGFALAEGLKHPRILEVYYWRNNCWPTGKNGYTKLTKERIEEYVNGHSCRYA